MSKAVLEDPEWQAPPETPPSELRQEEPRLARMAGLIGLMLVALAAFGFLFQLAGREGAIGPGLRVFFACTGLACMLYHAARDGDLQVRRTYGLIGLLFLIATVVFSVVPAQGAMGALFLPYGVLSLPLALLFLLAYSHHETDPMWRRAAVWMVGAGAVALALTGFIGGNVSPDFLLPYGMMLVLLGLAYAWGFIALLGANSDRGYRAAWAVGAVGALVFLVALARSLVPAILQIMGRSGRAEQAYFASAGLLLMSLGLAYVGLSLALCSDNDIVVLARRELAAFFYSPIAYIVFFGLTFIGTLLFLLFVNNIIYYAEQRQPLVEPIIQYYIIDFVPVVSVLVIVPFITMRLLSEERRTGTMEVLLTAPVSEASVVLGKFFAAWLFFMLLWVPWGLFLAALRVEGGQQFDWRPLLSFFIGLSCSGAGFLAMGLFFSSLTRNQIASAVLTFMGMMGLIVTFFLIRLLPQTNAWRTVLTHASFINLWQSTLQGKLVPRDLVFHLSFAVFWLFVTTKVLEARKWS